MKIGKLPEQVLVRSILRQVHHRREEVLIGPAVGQDCAAFCVAEDEAVIMSADPITGTTKDIGSLAVYITTNDLAAGGAEPIGIMLTVLLPERIREIAVKRMMSDIEAVCAKLNIEVLGGHTEVTNVVNQPLISVTGVAKIKKNRLNSLKDIKPDQDLVVTKWIGLEGTTILAKEKEEELLSRFSPSFLRTAMDFDQYLSVMPESRIAMEYGISAMHDITEGGIFGALWEMVSGAGLGLEADLKQIPIKQETIEICEFFHVNPYQLMSSGSMLIATEDGAGLVEKLEEAGIHGTVIGRTRSGSDRVIKNGEEIRFLDKPQPDELYKIL